MYCLPSNIFSLYTLTCQSYIYSLFSWYSFFSLFLKNTIWSGALFSAADLGSYRPAVSSLCWDVARDTLLIGTRGSEIYEISASDGSDQHGGPLIQGHCEFELWGLDVHPSKSQVCTYTSFPVFFSFLFFYVFLCFFIPTDIFI